MKPMYRPGQRVEQSGIYRVVLDDGSGEYFEVTSVEGEHFPPTRNGKRARYELVRAAAHAREHEKLQRCD